MKEYEHISISDCFDSSAAVQIRNCEASTAVRVSGPVAFVDLEWIPVANCFSMTNSDANKLTLDRVYRYFERFLHVCHY